MALTFRIEFSSLQGRAEGPTPPNDWGGSPGPRGARLQAPKKEKKKEKRKKRKKEEKEKKKEKKVVVVR